MEEENPIENVQIGHGQNVVSQQEDPENFYELSDGYMERIKLFRTDGQTFELKFKNLEKADITMVGASVFDNLLNRVADTKDSNVRLGLCIRHPSLDRPMLIPFRKREAITGDAVMREIERVMQSVKALQFDESIEITITRVTLPSGAGRDRNKMNWSPWFSRHCGNGGCFIQVKNSSDSLCLARAVVTAKVSSLALFCLVQNCKVPYCRLAIIETTLLKPNDSSNGLLMEIEREERGREKKPRP